MVKKQQSGKYASNPKMPKTCSILAPFGLNVSIIKSALWHKGIEPIIPSQYPVSGKTITEHMLDVITNSDMIIAVLDFKQPNFNINFELGYAFGLNKKVLILIPPDLEPPSDIFGLFYIRASSENREAITFAIDQVLNAPESRKHKHKPPPPYGHPIDSPKINDLLLQLDRIEETGNESEILQIVSSALKMANTSAISTQVIGTQERADFAVWVDELTPFLGNPVLIEVKRTLNNKEQIRRAYEQVAKYLKISNSQWAVILYVTGPSSLPNIPELTLEPIIFLKVRDLLEALKKNSFAQVIKQTFDRQNQWSDNQ